MSRNNTAEGWQEIAKALCTTERTARRWAARYPGLVRKHRMTGRVFAHMDVLQTMKAAVEEGEPIGVTSARGTAA